MSNIVIKCPSCGTYVEGKTGFLKHSLTCPECGKDISPKRDSNVVVTCPECGQNVMFDTTKQGNQECPVCGTSLAAFRIKDIEVECPNCHMREIVKNNETIHTCPICGISFDAQKAKAQKEAEVGTASVITVPFDNNDVIWVHPGRSFPFASQVVVPEGYTALILRNGRCTSPSKPGNYLLSDSVKTLDEQLQNAVFDSEQQISVQILFVKNNIDSLFAWTRPKEKVPDEQGGIAGTLGIGGEIQLGITDAKKLADFVGYVKASVNDLIDPGKPLYEKVCQECFNASYKILRAAVINNGFTFKTLEMNRPIFESDIQKVVNEKLADFGLVANTFMLSFITFVESDDASSSKRINTFVEKPFEWKSREIRIKNDDSRYADVQFGGSIKFRVSDRNALLGRSEIKEWISSGVSESVVKDYFSNLASSSASDVLSTRVQMEINTRGTDVRNLSDLCPQIKSTILAQMQNLFNGYGLEAEQFTFAEINRRNSEILEKEIAAEGYRAGKTIDVDTHVFDNDSEVRLYESDTIKNLRKDDIDVAAETHRTENNDQRTKNIIAGMHQKYSVKSEADQIERDDQIKFDHWNYEDHKKEHERNVEDYQFAQEEGRALHYLNQQIIRDNAEELRSKWEEQSKLDYDQLQQMIMMDEFSADAGDRRTMKNRELAYRIKQGDAENDRVINSILRKIAESDLEFKEKMDEYNRVLSNNLAGDKLNQYVAEAKAKTDALYESDHVRNLLTEEENKILEDARQREADRLERIKDAEFMRSLKQQELFVQNEMEKLKMEYDSKQRESEAALEIRNKDMEIEKLRMLLDHYEKLDENEVQRIGIREINNRLRVQAESQFKAEIAKQEKEDAERREKESLDRDERLSERADELLTRMLSIQEAMKKLGMENEKTYIQEQANVAKAHAEASVQNNDDMEKLLKQMEKIAKTIKKEVKSINKVGGTYYAPEITQSPIPAAPSPGSGISWQQPAVRRCPHCGSELPAYALTVCPVCYGNL